MNRNEMEENERTIEFLRSKLSARWTDDMITELRTNYDPNWQNRLTWRRSQCEEQ
jgi:hypothetical protein